jgi:hypothetical protein
MSAAKESTPSLTPSKVKYARTSEASTLKVLLRSLHRSDGVSASTRGLQVGCV